MSSSNERLVRHAKPVQGVASVEGCIMFSVIYFCRWVCCQIAAVCGPLMLEWLFVCKSVVQEGWEVAASCGV